MFSNRKELRWELLLFTHRQEPSCFCYHWRSPGTRSNVGCDGVVWVPSKWRLNPGLGIERLFWATCTLLGPSPELFCLVWWGSRDRGERSGRTGGERRALENKGRRWMEKRHQAGENLTGNTHCYSGILKNSNLLWWEGTCCRTALGFSKEERVLSFPALKNWNSVEISI